MDGRITLRTSLIRRILTSMSGAENGQLLIDLGPLGEVMVGLDDLSIGVDAVRLPATLHFGGQPSSRPIEASLLLTKWQIRDHHLWITLEAVGNLRGPILQATRKALISVCNSLLRRRFGDTIQLQYRRNQLGIDLKTLIGTILDLPFEIVGIEINDEISLDLRSETP